MQSLILPYPSTGNMIESIRKQQDHFQVDVTVLTQMIHAVSESNQN
jgi:hypothetical protein